MLSMRAPREAFAKTRTGRRELNGAFLYKSGGVVSLSAQFLLDQCSEQSPKIARLFVSEDKIWIFVKLINKQSIKAAWEVFAWHFGSVLSFVYSALSYLRWNCCWLHSSCWTPVCSLIRRVISEKNLPENSRRFEFYGRGDFSFLFKDLLWFVCSMTITEGWSESLDVLYV